MKFIELTNYDDGVTIAVNIQNIVLIQPTYNTNRKYDDPIIQLGTTIEAVNKRYIFVKEMYNEVLDKIIKTL